MLVHKAFRFRAYPSIDQISTLGRWNDALRSLWNLALSQWQIDQARAKEDRKYPTAYDQISQLTDLRADLPWLAEVPRNVSDRLLIELNLAWQRCFKGLAESPRWKRKGKDFVSFCEPHPKVWSLKGSTLTFPKLGDVRLVVHRELEGKPKTCTLARDGDQWFASIVCEVEIPDPPPRRSPKVAIDRGITSVVATSDGDLIPGPQRFKSSLKGLARQQQKLARCNKGSKNQQKAKLRVMKKHRKIRRQRHWDDHTVALGETRGQLMQGECSSGSVSTSSIGLEVSSSWCRRRTARRNVLSVGTSMRSRVEVRSSAVRGAGILIMRTSTQRKCCYAVRIARCCLWRESCSRAPREAGK